jgi:RNA polymerase sigma factor (sigma-70 family)
MSAVNARLRAATSNTAFLNYNADQAGERGLVAAAKCGEREALEILWKRSSQKILKVTRRITKNKEDAEDALQDCLLSAFVHFKDFDGRSSFSTWLTRIAINSALMILRKKRASREMSMEGPQGMDEAMPFWEVPDSAPNPERRYVQQEREKILHEAITGLRPAIRRVIEIQSLQEHSLKEAASQIGISVAATKARLFHAKMALRKSSRLKSMLRRPMRRHISRFGVRRAA